MGRHTHVRDYFVRIISGSTLEAFDGDGKSLGTVELESGATMYFRVQDDKVVSDRPGYPVVPATHSARNIGSKPYREVLVEFKK